MTTASLGGAYAKLDRAIEHLELFKEETGRIEETVVKSLVTKTTFDPDGQRFLTRVVREPPVPPRISAIAGDVIHNLRSALDYLAYELVVLATGEPWDNTQWPIVVTFEELEGSWRFKGLRKKLLRAGRDDLWAVVESHQAVWYEESLPPPGGDWLTQRYADLALVMLAELSNQDKHRLLLETFFNVREYRSIKARCIQDCENPRAIEDWLWYTLKLNAPPLVQWKADITGPNPEMEVDFDFIPRPIGLTYVVSGSAAEYLVLLADRVRTVLEDFKPFLLATLRVRASSPPPQEG